MDWGRDAGVTHGVLQKLPLGKPNASRNMYGPRWPLRREVTIRKLDGSDECTFPSIPPKKLPHPSTPMGDEEFLGMSMVRTARVQMHLQ